MGFVFKFNAAAINARTFADCVNTDVKTDVLSAGRKGLEMEYNPKFHPVMDRQKYPDIVNEDGIQPVTRIAVLVEDACDECRHFFLFVVLRLEHTFDRYRPCEQVLCRLRDYDVMVRP